MELAELEVFVEFVELAELEVFVEFVELAELEVLVGFVELVELEVLVELGLEVVWLEFDGVWLLLLYDDVEEDVLEDFLVFSIAFWAFITSLALSLALVSSNFLCFRRFSADQTLIS